ncbi:MAG: hypothetical protein JW719_01895 [Pirellulales bacterium]|nr:hypothetical protein [Pirellulales bacterium]
MSSSLRAVFAALILAVVSATTILAKESDNPFDKIHVTLGPAASTKEATTPGLESEVEWNVAERQVPALGHTEAELRIRKALAEKITLNFTDAELGEVVAHLKCQLNIEIQFDKESLEQLDLGSDTCVTCTVKDVPLRSALKLLLRPLELTTVIRDDVLLITSREEAEQMLVIVIYDVADLITYRDQKGKPWTDYEPLIRMLTETVAPDSWSEMGGNGTIVGENFNTARVLVVKQTEQTQVEIAGVLEAIRAVAAQTPGDGQPPLRHRPATSPPPCPPSAKPGAMGSGMTVPSGAGFGGASPAGTNTGKSRGGFMAPMR